MINAISDAATTKPDADVADPYDLDRFVDAQRSTYPQALAELRAGRKRSHWSWYVLPQLRGLGQSPLSIRYAISGLDEAEAYVEHPLLGARLHETIAALIAHDDLSAEQILGPIDAMKLHSCITLFGRVRPGSADFAGALNRYFAGLEDPATIALLSESKRL